MVSAMVFLNSSICKVIGFSMAIIHLSAKGTDGVMKLAAGRLPLPVFFVIILL